MGGGFGAGVRRWRRPMAAALALLVTGCYTYTPVETGHPDAGSEVRVGLTEPASDELARRTGRDVEGLEGRVVRASADSIAVSISPLAPRGYDPYGLRRDTLAFALDDVRQVERQELDTGTTLLLVGGAVAGAALLFTLMLDTGGGGIEGGGGGNQADIRVFSVPVR